MSFSLADVAKEMEMLRDPNYRYAGAEKLNGHYAEHSAHAVPDLVWALFEEDRQEVRKRILETLARIGEKAPGAVPRPEIAVMPMTQLRHAEEQKKDPVFGPAIATIQDGMRKWNLEMTVGTYVAAILAAALRDRAALRAMAIKSIRNLPDCYVHETAPYAIPAIIEAMKVQNPKMREDAIWALHKYGKSAACCAEPLIDMMTHEWGNEITEVLVKIGPQAEPFIPKLLPLLDDKTPKLRLRAIKVLRAIGVKSKNFKNKLRQMTLQDQDSEVRDAAIGYLNDVRQNIMIAAICGAVMLALIAAMCIGIYYLVQ